MHTYMRYMCNTNYIISNCKSIKRSVVMEFTWIYLKRIKLIQFVIFAASLTKRESDLPVDPSWCHDQPFDPSSCQLNFKKGFPAKSPETI
jgi:hypothetical protein